MGGSSFVPGAMFKDTEQIALCPICIRPAITFASDTRPNAGHDFSRFDSSARSLHLRNNIGSGAYGRRFKSYSTMDATMPAPTVRPPSRMAKRSFSSIAIGTISSTATVTLSPGMTISVPSGSVTMPVTSVVRK